MPIYISFRVARLMHNLFFIKYKFPLRLGSVYDMFHFTCYMQRSFTKVSLETGASNGQEPYSAFDTQVLVSVQESMEEGSPTDTDSGWDLSSMREDEFEKHVVYIVPDLPTEPGCPNRAESSLPRNLVLKPSQALSDVSTPIRASICRRYSKVEGPITKRDVPE